jgi:hypothetical protein
MARRATAILLAPVASLFGCAAQLPAAGNQAPVNTSELPTNCEPTAPGALVAQPSVAPTMPRSHTVTTSSKLELFEAVHVRGPCVDEIVRYSLGYIAIGSRGTFFVGQGGKAQWHPPQGLVEEELPTRSIASLVGYELIMAEPVRRRSRAGATSSYIGLFKRTSHYLIARFDLTDGRPSQTAEVLLQSRSPIASLDFFLAADTADGWIGLVERVRKGEAWLYGYRWNHGNLRSLP